MPQSGRRETQLLIAWAERTDPAVVEMLHASMARMSATWT